jgi:hypothetical protein
MAVKPETTYIGRVHKHLPKHVYHMKNNNPYLGGVPDVWYSANKGDLWVEYKYVPKIPKSVPVRVPALLSKLQTEWLNARREEGRNVAVIVGCSAGGVLLKDGDWEGELSPSHFTALIQSNAELAAWIKEQVAQ